MEKNINKDNKKNNNNINDDKNSINIPKNKFNNINELNNNKTNYFPFSPLNNQQFSNNYNNIPNDVFNNLYPNNHFNSKNQMMFQSNFGNFNNTNNYNNYYINQDDNNNQNIFEEFNNPNINQQHQEINLPRKNIKNKNIQKRTNYIPKNLITFSSPEQAQNININPQKLNQNQDYYMTPCNMYYNNILYPENKSGFESQNSNQRKTSNNYYNNSPNDEIDNNFRNIIKDINVEEVIDKNAKNDNRVFKAFSHVFNANIDEVKETLIDQSFFKNSCPPSIIDNIQFTLNNKSNVKGNMVSLRWKKFYTLELLCTKVYSSKKYKSYTLSLINLKPVNMGNLDMNFKYYYNSCQNNTLFIIEYILNKGILSEVFKEEFLDIDMNEICKNCERVLKSRKIENTHLSSIMLKAPKDYAWSTIINLNQIKHINYLNEYDLEYVPKDIKNKNNNIEKENNLEKGDTIIIKRKKNKTFAKLIIEEINETKEKNDIIFKCEKPNENENKNEKNIISENKENNNNQKNVEIIEQKIYLSIKEIKKNLSFCEFKHTWNAPISDKKITILNFLKNHSLILFKSKIEENKDFYFKNKLTSKNKNKEVTKEDNNNNDNSIIINFFNLFCPINNNIIVGENEK